MNFLDIFTVKEKLRYHVGMKRDMGRRMLVRYDAVNVDAAGAGFGAVQRNPLAPLIKIAGSQLCYGGP